MYDDSKRLKMIPIAQYRAMVEQRERNRLLEIVDRIETLADQLKRTKLKDGHKPSRGMLADGHPRTGEGE